VEVSNGTTRIELVKTRVGVTGAGASPPRTLSYLSRILLQAFVNLVAIIITEDGLVYSARNVANQEKYSK
jgi:hypothetical protein